MAAGQTDPIPVQVWRRVRRCRITQETPNMNWKDEYAFGIQEIDDHYRILLTLVTEFEHAVEGRSQWDTVQPLMARTREFVKFHFAVKASLMQIVRYPLLPAHRDKHQYVLRQISILEHKGLGEEMKGELLPLMHSWLFRHIIEGDKHFSRYLIDHYGDPACAYTRF